MSAITKRLDALEARAEPSRPLVVLFPEPGEDAAAAWARSRPNEPFDPDAPMLAISWMRPNEHDGGEGR